MSLLGLRNGVCGRKWGCFCAIDSTTLTVKFNKAVDANTATNPANYKIDGVALDQSAWGSLASSDLKLSEDKKSVTVNLKITKSLANGTTYRVSVSDVKDVAGTKIAAYEALYKFEDKTAPTVVSTKYNHAEKKFYINFSEPVKSSTATLVKVFDKNNADVTGSLVSLSSNQKTIVIDASSLNLNETYKVVMLGAQDLSDNYFANNRVEASFTVAKTETVAPTVSSLEVKDRQTVRVVFSEPIFVDASNSNKIATIALDGGTATNVVKVSSLASVGDAVDVNGDGMTWDIRVSATNLTGVKKVTINAVQDLQGNALVSAFDKFVTFAADTNAPSLVSYTTAGSKLYLTFDEATILTAGSVKVLTPDNVEKTVSLTTGASGTLTNDGANTKVVVVDLGSAISKNGSYKVTIPSGIISDSATPANSKAYEVTTNFTVGADTTKPTLKMNTGGTAVDSTAVVQTPGNPSEITITFSEKMNSTALNVDNYTLNGVKAFSSAVFVGDTDTVRLTVKPGTIDVTGSYIVGINNVQDLAGNVIDSVSYLEDAPLKENVAPTVTSAKLIAANTIRVNFSEAIASYTADPFEVYVDGAKVAVNTISALASGGTNAYVDITLTNALTDLSKPITVKVKSDAVLKDANGNALVTGGTYTVTQ
ncbi:hypothetical protein GGR02_003551 [Anoxybacillus voinovskiensis]|uniref:SbsA Ig-like domain-containing protein n=1 Tax=Anoxybacteroides voinovskiense TaxID=230470 RepID=A0A840DYQ5_9BACL|nr:Ig-like domain-containing protein [Anoxybacillus voinovskiensis]MBB4075697.1 hypothetical protein [Anoxybacillus voinovskiensis]GGJ80984.1 hypothetical protein GCM10008982_33150 [Anoxybacillus voinovskiensis]